MRTRGQSVVFSIPVLLATTVLALGQAANPGQCETVGHVPARQLKAATSRAPRLTATVIYVDKDATPPGGGSSWATAFTDLQNALVTAQAGDQIWVADGTYKPSVPTGRDASFQMAEGVSIYGGFDGTETSRQQRDWVTNITILSGNIGAVGSASDNSYHVVWGAPDATIDGFTIRDGNADGSGPDHQRRAGGLYCEGTSPTVRNCTFTGNYGMYGGAIETNYTAAPLVEHCLFVGNTGSEGGCIANDATSPTIRRCTFANNTATEQGGGVHNTAAATPAIANCLFYDNIAVNEGGALLNEGGSLPTVVNCTFSGNSSGRGGAVYNYASSPVYKNCIFWGDTATTSGNEFYNDAGSAPSVTYSCVAGGYSGTGNIAYDPLFADPPAGDFHLKSTGGRWDPSAGGGGGGWVIDAETSPCIDAGDPASEYSDEPEPNGDRINMGADGNTGEASKSPGPPIAIEHGAVWAGDNWTTVDLAESFTDPVVVAGPATSIGLQPGVVRVRNVTSTSFQVRFQEWDYLDGWHCAERIHWLAVERGTYDLGGGKKLIAGSFVTNKTNVYWPKWVSFPEAFSETPVVLTQVQTLNGWDAVTDRICGVYPGGMRFSMQEQESKTGHCNETVGYIAVSVGATDLLGIACEVKRTGAVVTHNPYTLTGSQGQCKVRVQEEQSKDAETLHRAAEKVGFISLAGQPPLVADMQTCNGKDPCELRCTLLSATQGERQAAPCGELGLTLGMEAWEPAGACTLLVRAEGEGGAELTAVDIAVGDRVTEGLPLERAYEPGETVTLAAPTSLAEGGEVWVFSHWEIDGEPLPPGQATVQVEMTGDREAVAVYLRQDAGP